MCVFFFLLLFFFIIIIKKKGIESDLLYLETFWTSA